MIVSTEKVLAGSGWGRVKARGQYQQCAHGWKSGRHGCTRVIGLPENAVEILSHVPSEPAIVPSPCGMLSRDQSLRSDTWIGKRFLAVRVQLSIRHRHLIKECFTLGMKVLQAETQHEIVHGHLSLEVKNEIERLFQRRDLQGTINHEYFLPSRRVTPTELRGSSTKTLDLGASF